MTEMTVSEARARLADVVGHVRITREPIVLTRRGRRVAAVIDSDQLAQLFQAADDLAARRGRERGSAARGR